MPLVRHTDARAFARLARPLYDADPLRHTVALTVLDGVARAGERAALAATLHSTGRVEAAILRTAGRPLVSGVPGRCAPAIVAELDEADLTGAQGPVRRAEAFADAWLAHAGGDVRAVRRLRLFALDELLPPRNVPGAARLAGPADVEILSRMMLAFAREEDGVWTDAEPPRVGVERRLRIGHGELLWEIDGKTVAQASVRPPVAGMCRIGPVYTDPAHRGHGYAAAVTTAASLWARRAAAQHVLLFTDAADALTNRLYPRLGFRFHHDAVELDFSSS